MMVINNVGVDLFYFFEKDVGVDLFEIIKLFTYILYRIVGVF